MLKTVPLQSTLIAIVCSISAAAYAYANAKPINVPADGLISAPELATQNGQELQLDANSSGAPLPNGGGAPGSGGEQKPMAYAGAMNPNSLLAQSAAPHSMSADQTTPSKDEEQTTRLEEVIVTAQRREEDPDKVPMSLTALSQKTMDELHVQSFSDLAGVVPGLTLTTPGGFSQAQTDVAIRGIFSGGNAATTGIYIDETPIVIREFTAVGNSGSPWPDIYDLDRVEVLRGPQGTLFGSGAMGGAIRYITPQPNLDDASGNAKLEIGFTDRGAPSYAVGVAYGAPIIQGEAGFRLSGWFHSDGGFIDIEDPYTGQIVKHNANSSQTYVLRPAFKIVPTEGLSITPAVFIQHRNSDASDIYWLTEIPKPEAGAYATGFGATGPVHATDDLTVPSLAIRYDFHNISLQSDTSYTDRRYHNFDDDSNIFGPLIFGLPPTDPALSSFSSFQENIESTRAWQQEVRLASQHPAARLSWVVGAYYRHAYDGLLQVVSPDVSPITELAVGQTSLQFFGVPDYTYNGQALSAYTSGQAVTEQKAVFGEISYDVFRHLKVNIGVRVEHSAIEQQLQIIAGPLNGVAYQSFALPDQVQTPVTPRFGVTYQYTDQDMVYATAAKGYRAGGGNSGVATDDPLCVPSVSALGLTSVPTTYNSDSLWSYEIGTKDSFFGRRITIQTSVYYIDWTNIQTEIYLPSCSQAFTANRGKAISQGFDLQFATLLTDGLRLSGNVGYDNGYHPNAMYGAPTNGVTPLLIGAGDKLTGVPPWSASAHAEYSRDLGQLWIGARCYIRVDYHWLDAYPKANPNIANYDPAIGPYPNQAYGILNLRLGVLKGGLDLSGFVDNATRSNPLLAYFHAGPGDPLFSATAIRPLTAGITALYRF